MILCCAAMAQAQETISGHRIPPQPVGEAGDARAGSCMSPDGPILGDVLTDYPPSFNWLSNNGHCYDIPTTKNATWCWTFTAPGTEVTLDCGFSVDVCGGAWAYWFSAFKLYTCAPACALVGTGLTFTGLTPGACYTWCFNTNFDGCGAAYGFTVLCPYVIYDGPVLPIELEAFDAYSETGVVHLSWKVATEHQVESYAILRSADGIGFEEIGTISATGNTNAAVQYNYTDLSPQGEVAYYRLEQVHADGSRVSSHVIACAVEQGEAIVRHYTLNGVPVVLSEAPAGVYVEETITGQKTVRKLIVHAQ